MYIYIYTHTHIHIHTYIHNVVFVLLTKYLQHVLALTAPKHVADSQQ